MRVANKAQMYALLQSGAFGNTNAQWTEAHDWGMATQSFPWCNQKLWGVRSLIPADPRTRLNVPTDQVWKHIEESGLFAEDCYNISPMVPVGIRWEGDCCRRHDGPGLLCSGNLSPEPGSWRQHMKHPKLWEGSAALVLLRSVLNENSYDDLMILLDEYPDHVVELTALDECYGSVPGRNAVVWEVRDY